MGSSSGCSSDRPGCFGKRRAGDPNEARYNPTARGRNALNTHKKVKMNTLEKLKVHKMLSALTIAIGFVLMLGKIYADSEPGAIPILLVVLGMGWYFITRVRSRSHQK